MSAWSRYPYVGLSGVCGLRGCESIQRENGSQLSLAPYNARPSFLWYNHIGHRPDARLRASCGLVWRRGSQLLIASYEFRTFPDGILQTLHFTF